MGKKDDFLRFSPQKRYTLETGMLVKCDIKAFDNYPGLGSVSIPLSSAYLTKMIEKLV